MKSERCTNGIGEGHPAWLAFFRKVKSLAAELDAFEATTEQKAQKPSG